MNYLVALILEKNKEHNQYDLLDDIGIFPRSDDEEELVIKQTSDNNYYVLVRFLNEKQRRYFLSCVTFSNN